MMKPSIVNFSLCAFVMRCRETRRLDPSTRAFSLGSKHFLSLMKLEEIRESEVSSFSKNVLFHEINDSNDDLLATHALLFSSWNDGVMASLTARTFLKYSLIKKALVDKIIELENQIKISVEFSPCCGPNMDTLNNLEFADNLYSRGEQILEKDDCNNNGKMDMWSIDVLQYLFENSSQRLDFKVLYIPTAMYALNPRSTTSPGKQRQRMRSDAKKRRDQILCGLEDLFRPNNGSNKGASSKLNILAVTLDLHDGSLKHPVGFDHVMSIPVDDETAFTSWNPHLIYIEGGNTFWLQHCIDKGNYSQLIKDACLGKNGAVYCGKSAGAIVAGKTLDTATWKRWDDPSVVPDRDSYENWYGCKSLGLIGNKSFFPHMSNDWNDLIQEKKADPNVSYQTVCLCEDVFCVIGDKKIGFMVGRLNNQTMQT